MSGMQTAIFCGALGLAVISVLYSTIIFMQGHLALQKLSGAEEEIARLKRENESLRSRVMRNAGF